MEKTVRIRLKHHCSIPHARWCEPVGWAPTNEIQDAEYIDGSWWSHNEEEAGLVWLGDRDAYADDEIVEANLDDLRVVSCGDCRVIEAVQL